MIALLTELDGFTGTHVQVIAATNRADTLDSAIMRPGRLDRKIQVPAPDRLGREKILLVHSKGKPLAGDVDFTMIAKRTQGMTGADLSYLINEAAMEAVRGKLTLIDQGCFERAIGTVSMGRARVSALVTDEDRAITAWHEAGHTLCAYFQKDGDKPVSVSIVPRGAAGGVTWITGSDNLFLPRNRALAQLVTALGGRAGEEVLLKGEFTQGAHNDLAKATELALAMTTQYGMTEAGLMVRSNNTLHAGGMDGANSMVEELLSSALDSARKIMVEHAELLSKLAAALLESESLELAEIESILGGSEAAVA